VALQSGAAARARSVNRAVAASGTSASRVTTVSPRTCSGAWLVTSTRRSGAPFEQLGDGGTTGQDLLEVVEHEQRSPPAQPRREAGRQFAAAVCELERARNGRQDAGGIADRRERDHEGAAGQIVEQPPREREREARLTRPASARPASRTGPRPPAAPEMVELAVAAHERREVRGKVRSAAPQPCQRAELSGAAPVAHHMEEPLRAGEVLEPVLAEVLDLGLLLQQGARRGRNHDLAAVGGRPDPCGAVHLQADVPELVRSTYPVWTPMRTRSGSIPRGHAAAASARWASDAASTAGTGVREGGEEAVPLDRLDIAGVVLDGPARRPGGGRRARPATRPPSRAPAASSPRCR
jgi:hypothetical protein